ncbi:hypothetical protein [Lacticaseibacillus mingshuiensis]|uniref:Uncharacterized protein n=1 Tax=Lacticaseibacillus mingshuiensis TaxID=2799574 RepID=A0ABW4CI77_9LACO|nr:hypothetical protein [Lacticaseibacillus mingshuiensis]
MTDDEYDALITKLGKLNDARQQLEDYDYPSAMAKGYSGRGLSLQEIKDKLAALNEEITQLEAKRDSQE